MKSPLSQILLYLVLTLCFLPSLALAQTTKSASVSSVPSVAEIAPVKLNKVQQQRLTELDQQIGIAKAAVQAAQARFEATRQRAESSTESVSMAELQLRIAQTEHTALVKFFDYSVLQCFIESRLDPDKYEQKLSVIDLVGSIGFAVKPQPAPQPAPPNDAKK